MAVDRGGLNYTIQVTDQFSKATQKFVSEMDAVRAAFAAVKAESQGLAAVNSNISVTLNAATAASARKTRQLTAEEEAERKLTATLRARIVQEELRNLAAAKGVDLSNGKIRQLTIEQEAERKLLAAQRASAVARKADELATQRGIDLSRKKAQSLSVEQEAQAKVEKALRARAVLQRAQELAEKAGIEVGKAKVKQLSIEEAALQKVADAERRLAIQTRAQQIAQARFIGPQPAPGFVKPPIADGATLTGLARARQLVQQFREQIAQTDKGGNDLIFTFRRLFGVLALFQAARAAFNAFTDFIKAGIEFNSVIETSRLGIASIIQATSELATEQGKVTDQGQAFALAQQEAARQQALLRGEALKTTATFEQLIETFQVAIGPGLGAGLNLDQIRKFSVQISQAASAIGLSQNQLSEEIRSILSGTIQQRTTRIAASLGITNEDIRKAKETGKLFELLQTRFASFGVAGDAASKSFTGLVQILKGGIEALAGAASAPLFDELKSTLKQIIDLVLTVGPDGAIIINPDAIQAVAPIFQGILVAIESIKKALSTIGFNDLKSSAVAIGTALALAGEVIGGVLRGIIDGFTVVVNIVGSLVGLFNTQGKSLQDIVALVTKYTVIFGSAVAAAGLMGFALNALLSPLNQIITLMSTLLSSTLRVVSAFLSLPPAILAALGEFVALAAIVIFVADKIRDITSAIFGVNLTIKDTIELISLGFIGGITDAIHWVEELSLKIRNNITLAFQEAVNSAENFITQSKQFLAALVGNDSEAQALAAQLIQDQLRQEHEIFNKRRQGEIELADLRSQNQAKAKAIEGEIAKVVGEAAGKDALGQIPNTLQEILGGLGSFFKDFDLGFSKLGGKGSFSLEKILNLDDFKVKLQKAMEDASQQTATTGVTFTPRGLPVTDEQKKALLDAQAKLQVLQQQNIAQREINRLQAAGASDAIIRLQTLFNQRAELQTQIQSQRELNALELRKAQDAIGGAQGLEQRKNLETQLEVLKQQQAAEEEGLTQKIQATNIELLRQQNIVSGTIGGGISQGIKDFANQFASAFQAGINIATGILQGFVSFASDSIVAAFDPTNNTDITERFARFLQDIAKLILQQMLQVQIAKLLGQTEATAVETGSATAASAIRVAGATQAAGIELAAAEAAAAIRGVGGFGFATGGLIPAIGFATGGMIPARGGRPSMAHYGMGVQGLARGGMPRRPSHLDSRDTVPIWAQPGEFMQNLSAVQTYGRDFMERLNARVLDPGALRALAGLGGTRTMLSASQRGPGFAKGGLISEQIARSNTSQAVIRAQAGGVAGAQGTQRAIVVAGEDAFDKLLAGGQGAMIRFMRENKDTLRGILNR